MDWPSGPGIPWLETEGPGLKPNRVKHGFRGMNASSPSEAANKCKGNVRFRPFSLACLRIFQAAPNWLASAEHAKRRDTSRFRPSAAAPCSETMLPRTLRRLIEH